MKFAFSAFVAIALLACSSDKDEEHFLSTQEKVLDKSKQVQSAIDEQAEKARKQIEQQTQ